MMTKLICSLLISLGLLLGSVLAQGTYPDKPITLIQGFGTGGNSDTIARIIAPGLAKELGQQIIVEAKTGAGGNIASAAVAKSLPDGYTLILLTGGHAVSAAVYSKLTFNPVDDFEWISLVTQFPFAVSVSAESKFKTLADVIAAAKAAPDTISYTSVGIGSTQHLSGELFASMAGVRMTHIPYKGGAGPLQDILGGRVDVMFDSITVTKAQMEAGKLRALGVTSLKPYKLLPGVPPVADTIPGYEVTSWTGLAAPKGTSPEIQKRLHTALLKVLADPEVISKLENTGGLVTPSSSGAQMKQYVSGQIAKWRKVLVSANIPQQ
ncbi:tripartite tricarboxylate transporter substrate binding protein [Polynucleobacter sp. AP-Latsch-80-C2]|jgi:tripartite-type tricarboxylate transporter receptor subunit TctC|uniref:Bug family tripartite tricarboxylate transporter substrate binding protein n=1 Tax=Polynucleobacter sp. AP-Latsch-80-C2 TaxID=2576931 RepID=UPI001C0E0BE0|nr:tripartite tricarboxylate transporter substrate binding protein [Polynucleobacter sp. AP-Latsch-80-C2]MBU3623823.1 tripartite tricarboxylate transporter substrate binding protein [Polynucleobacter sp. AP-Latsch-80-C2]